MWPRLSRDAQRKRADDRQRENEEKLKLITAVEKRPCIWDRRLKEHKDLNAVDAAWREISAIMNWEKKSCRKIWKHTLDYFRNLYFANRPDGASRKNAVNGRNAMTWPFFTALLFMQDVITRRESSPHASEEATTTITQTSSISGVQEIETDTDSSSKVSRPETPTQTKLLVSNNTSEQNDVSQRGIKRSHSTELQMTHQFNEQPSTHNPGRSRRDDANVRFADYLVDVLRDVPPNLQRACHQTLLQVANSYADGVHPIIVIPE